MNIYFNICNLGAMDMMTYQSALFVTLSVVRAMT